MPRVHHVKKARKANKQYDIKKGDEYWWAAFKTGPRSGFKRCWKKPPRPSQLTLSEFYSTVLGHQEAIDDSAATATTVDGVHSLGSDMESAAEEIRQLGDDQEEKLNNMPEGLQQGSTGELLQSRADECQTLADELEQAGSELSSFEFEPEEGSEETEEEACRAAVEEQLSNVGWSVS